MPQLQPPESLLDVLLDYEAHVRITMPQKKADATMAQVRTALWRYTLPGWQFPSPQGQRLTQEEHERGLNFLKQLPLKQLKDAPEVQERLFEQLAVPGNSRRNYRWALNNFIDWCKQQSWFQAEFEVPIQRSSTRKRQRKRAVKDVRLTTRKARQMYRLSETERSEALQQELENFSQFLTEFGADGRAPAKASSETAKQYLNQVLRFLGWLHIERRIPLQELSLRQLVEITSESVGKDQKDLPPQAAAEKMIELVQAYLQWLREPKGNSLNERSEAIQSPYTELKVINTWLAVARFVYAQDGASEGKETEKARAAIEALRDLRRDVSRKLKNHRPVSDEAKKRLEWHEFLDLVEKLRGECVSRFPQGTYSKQSRSTLETPRSLTAIAQSYQRFLLAALLAYIPPQRPQVLRELVVSLPQLSEQPLNSQEFFGEESILYQDQDGWWIEIVERKTKRQSPHHLVSIPNLGYADGRCFYQYLEEWLLQYNYEDVQGKTVEVPGLRSCFDPRHSRLFTMQNGQPYQASPLFIKLLRHSAYRITAQAIDFHTVRRVYFEYLRNKEHSELKSENSARALQDEALSRALASPNLQKECEYNSADWQKAAEIAQEFLNQLV